MVRIRTFWILLFSIMLSASALYMLWPEARYVMIEEDNFVENVSALFYFVSMALAGYFFLVKREGHGAPLLALGLLGTMGFLSEISFGERLFGLEMPRIQQIKIDGFHDIIMLVQYRHDLWIEQHPAVFYASTGLLSVIALSLIYGLRAHLVESVRRIAHDGRYQFGAVVVGLLFMALFMDLDLIKVEYLYMTEELFEMCAAIALMWCITGCAEVPLVAEAKETCIRHMMIDAAAIFTSFIFAAWLRFASGLFSLQNVVFPPAIQHARMALFVTLITLPMLYGARIYERYRSHRLVIALALGLAMSYVCSYVLHGERFYSVRVIALTFIISLGLLLATRRLFFGFVEDRAETPARPA